MWRGNAKSAICLTPTGGGLKRVRIPSLLAPAEHSSLSKHVRTDLHYLPNHLGAPIPLGRIGIHRAGEAAEQALRAAAKQMSRKILVALAGSSAFPSLQCTGQRFHRYPWCFFFFGISL